MIITKEQQEAVVKNWIKSGQKNASQIDGFIDGMEAMFKLIAQIKKREDDERATIVD